MWFDRFVVLTTYSRALEAQIVARKLQSEGILWLLEEGTLPVRNTLQARVFRRVKIRVKLSDYPRARELLSLDCAERGRRAGVAYEVCPECGDKPGLSQKIKIRFQGEAARHRCDACGYWWTHSGLT
jgi:hypothetical protein